MKMEKKDLRKKKKRKWRRVGFMGGDGDRGVVGGVNGG